MTFIIATLIICAIIVFAYYVKSGHFFKSFFKGTILGMICLLLVVFCGQYVGITLPLNASTISFSSILGFPAVALMLVIKYIL